MAGQIHESALVGGHRLGRYEVVRSLAVDDLGIRYAARDHEAGTDVWIREYLPQWSAVREADGGVRGVAAAMFDIGLARFLADGGVLERLDHPGVVRVRDRVRMNGTAYLVTEAAGETTLETLLESSGTLSEAQLREAGESLFDGLQHVHSAGMMHGRIRPDRIVVRPDGALSVTDFGTVQGRASGARGSFATVSPRAAPPAAATVGGTGYLAPEQYTERTEEGPWTDVYALGAVLYRCVTGQTPLDALQRALQDDMPAAVEAAAEACSPEFLAAIDRALTIRPMQRPRTVSEWRAGLAGGVERPATAGPRGRTARVSARGGGRGLPGGRRSLAGGGAPAWRGIRRWSVPAAAMLGVTATLTWLDAGLLRSDHPPLANPADVSAPPLLSKRDAATKGAREERRAVPGEASQARSADDDAPGGGAGGSTVGPKAVAAAAAPTPAEDQDSQPLPQSTEATPSGDGEEGVAKRPATSGDVAADVEAPSENAAEQAADDEYAAVAAVEDTPAPLEETALTVETEPPGVEVWIGDEPVGRTPLALAAFPSGTYDVSLRHPLYRTLDLPDREFAPLEHVRIERALTRATGDLRVSTEPPGASIEWGNGQAGGPTPTTLRNLPAGPLRLRLAAQGYLTQQVSTEVRRDDIGVLDVVLAVAYGTLTLDLEPGDATVGVEGPDGGPYTPGMQLPEGSHDVRVSRSGYRSTTQTVHVVGATRLRIALEPERPCPLRVRGTVPTPRYPVVRSGWDQRNIGSASMVVTFTVDDGGRVVEEELRVEAERSTVELPEYFDRFAGAAADTVRQYRFAFEETGDGPCTKRQRAGVRVRFRVPSGLL